MQGFSQESIGADNESDDQNGDTFLDPECTMELLFDRYIKVGDRLLLGRLNPKSEKYSARPGVSDTG